MKLRNKKTGEIKNVNHNKVLIHFNDGQTECINSLAELNEEWEDSPKESKGWYLDSLGEPVEIKFGRDDFMQLIEAIGNYFETKEEAEKAVEKLKAWKRLKDDLISLSWQPERDGEFSIWGQFRQGTVLNANTVLDVHKNDLYLLFGGEE